MERDARPEDFIGKTIVWVDIEPGSIWRLGFGDGSRLAIEAELFHTSAGDDIPVLQICEECATLSDISVIRSGDLIEAMEAAKRIIVYDAPVDPKLILELVEMAQNKTGQLSSRQASIYALGWVDRDGMTEPTLRLIARDADEPVEIREHAEEALYNFSQVRRQKRAGRIGRYADQSFDEWRASQKDLPA